MYVLYCSLIECAPANGGLSGRAVGLFLGWIEVEEGFVEAVVLLAPADIVFDAILFLPCTSIEVSLGIDQIFLTIIILETRAEITIDPFFLAEFVVLVVEVGAADGEADDCGNEDEEYAPHPFRCDFPPMAVEDALYLII